MRPAIMLALCFAFALPWGCASHAAIAPGYQRNPTSPQSKTWLGPDVEQGGSKWVQFPSGASNTSGIVVGPDLAMWYIGANIRLMRMDMTGTTTTVATFPTSGSYLALGSDGNFYVPFGNATIARVSPAGVIDVFQIPSGDSFFGNGITTGPDGNVWFVESAHVAVITPSGHIGEFRFPSFAQGITNSGITSGSDGKVWFSEGGVFIDSVDPSSGAIVEYSHFGCSSPESIVSGADGKLYFDCKNGVLGQMVPGGSIKLIPQPWGFVGTVQDLAVGPDKAIWFVSATNNVVGEYSYINRTTTAYFAPKDATTFAALAAGPDGNMWFSASNKIDAYVLKALTVSPKSLFFTAPGQILPVKVTENGTSNWTAQSSNFVVASVAQGPNARTFEVTAVGSGKCVITIADSVGNSFNVKVTVP